VTTRKELESIIIRLMMALEPFAFDGGESVCRYCGAGVEKIADGGWKGNKHLEFCILGQARECVVPTESVRWQTGQGKECPHENL